MVHKSLSDPMVKAPRKESSLGLKVIVGLSSFRSLDQMCRTDGSRSVLAWLVSWLSRGELRSWHLGSSCGSEMSQVCTL